MKVGIMGMMIAGAPTSSVAFAQETITCVKITEPEVTSMLDLWNNSLKTGDARIVSESYLSDAVLLPALSDKVYLTDKTRIDYFEKFLRVPQIKYCGQPAGIYRWRSDRERENFSRRENRFYCHSR